MTDISASAYFAVIPETVLYADISSNAVRVYGVLRRHADKDDNSCHPGRARIAKLAHISPSAVDRAIQQLVDAGFVTVHHRRDPENPKQSLSNRYVIHSEARVIPSTPPAGDYTPPASDHTPLPLVTTPPPAGDEVTIAIEPEPINHTTFDTFWNIYPRKIARKKCEQWWHKHATTNAQTIIEAATAATQQWRRDGTEPKYIPHPYTWLNQERWQDPPLIAALEREERAYDIPTHQCPTCDGTRYISHQDDKGRSWARPCPDCG